VSTGDKGAPWPPGLWSLVSTRWQNGWWSINSRHAVNTYCLSGNSPGGHCQIAFLFARLNKGLVVVRLVSGWIRPIRRPLRATNVFTIAHVFICLRAIQSTLAIGDAQICSLTNHSLSKYPYLLSYYNVYALPSVIFIAPLPWCRGLYLWRCCSGP